MMRNLDLSLPDVEALLHSMLPNTHKGAFPSAPPSGPGCMEAANRKELAHRAIRFFGLDPKTQEALHTKAEWRDWAEIISAQLPPTGPERLFFRTSGSTGAPVDHALCCDELCEEVNSLAPFFMNNRRLVSVMPIHHVFGFVFALLLPKVLGVSSLHVPPLPTADFFTALRKGDLLLAFPVFWKSLLPVGPGGASSAVPQGVHGVSSSAPCPPEVIEGLLQPASHTDRSVLASMTEIYGATEFGAVGIRQNCREGYTLLPHWQCCTLAPRNEHEAPIRGIQRSGAPAQALPDEVDWQDERRFIPRKRKDFAVQVGGVNVLPAKVADVLRSHPMIADCAVRLMRPEEGHRLKAFIVPAQRDLVASRAFIREIKHWCAERLTTAACPKHIRSGTSLPVTAAGKLADWDSME